MNIKHQPNKHLVIWTPTPILMEGVEGRVTGTIHEHAWFETRQQAVNAIRNLHPNWVDENPPENSLS